MNKFSVLLLSNRFISLLSEYGYTILLSIILAHISIQLVMLFWIVRATSAIIAMKINGKFHFVNKKKALIIFEILKALLIALIMLCKDNFFVLIIVFMIEILNILFNSTMYSIVPKVIDSAHLIKFNSLYTAIASISYFLAPLFVGLFVNFNQDVLFVIYSILLLIGAFILVWLPALILDTEKKNQKPNRKIRNWREFEVLYKNKLIFNMIVTSTLVGTLGVLFDAYEVVFITRHLKISNQAYSFSLSFLAIIFLIVSLMMSLKKDIVNFNKLYFGGLFTYILYLVVFANARNITMILISYVLLAVGQTIMGTVETNYQQKNLTHEELADVYTSTSTLNQCCSGIVVFVVGNIPNLSHVLANVFSISSIIVGGLALLMFFILIGPSFKNKEEQAK